MLHNILAKLCYNILITKLFYILVKSILYNSNKKFIFSVLLLILIEIENIQDQPS